MPRALPEATAAHGCGVSPRAGRYRHGRGQPCQGRRCRCVSARTTLGFALRVGIVGFVGLAGCKATNVGSAQAAPANRAEPRAQASAAHLAVVSPASAAPNALVTFRGMCDASGAVPLGASLFAVAADEDNVLRVYDAARGGSALYAVDVSPVLDLPSGRRTPEADIEAATRLGEYALWITSHGLSSRGKKQPGRFRFFATTAPSAGAGLAPVGRVYEALLDDMQACPLLAQFRLDRARRLAPRDPGGLNIEGMTRRKDGNSVLIGFRNPRPQGKALLVPLLNPLGVVRDERPQFGAPELLDLAGLGIRAMTLWHDRYLIAAGSAGNAHVSRLYAWTGETNDAPVALDVDLQELNPEAFVTFAAEPRVLVLSDDGTVDVGGTPCKHLADPNQQSFRGLWVRVPN
jgi:hypothetical protein